MQTLTLIVFIKLENSKNDGGKGECYIVFRYGFWESLGLFCFVLLKICCFDDGGNYTTAAAIIRFYLKIF